MHTEETRVVSIEILYIVNVPSEKRKNTHTRVHKSVYTLYICGEYNEW